MENAMFYYIAAATAASGAVNIALFYFFAQVIERILELLDWIASLFLPSQREKGEKAKRAKMIVMWVLASLMGLGFAYWFDLNLMARLDVEIAPCLDKIFTALILGSGTKPIHDIISLMGRGQPPPPTRSGA